MSENVFSPRVAYHRNGVCGRPMWVVHFDTDRTDVDGTVTAHTMVGIIPSPPEPGECFVLDTDLLAQGEITFGINSWRGDHYETPLREAIMAHQRERNEKDGHPEWPVEL